MENTKHGKRREGRWTPIRAKAQDTRANPNSWETHLVRKRWDIGLLQALSLRIMMMMMTINCAAELNMGLHLKACIGLTGVSSCLRDPLISRYNSLPEGLFKIATLYHGPIQFKHNKAHPG